MIPNLWARLNENEGGIFFREMAQALSACCYGWTERWSIWVEVGEMDVVTDMNEDRDWGLV